LQFFIGRELNPSIGSLDIKSFNELRPGLILWALIDISMACEQAVRRGGTITDSMGLVLLFQMIYVVDGLYNEPAILTTMDITTDGFGFMLAVGDLLWVPFVYSLQARYLVFNQVELGPMYTALILLVNFTGYWIFRDANGEKNDFRNGRNPKSKSHLTHHIAYIDNCSRPEIHGDEAWHQAAHFRMVGLVSPSQLPVRCIKSITFSMYSVI
jgi:Delta14-sterol reductase